MSAPVGQYDADKLLNIGTIRWSISPEIGISKALGRLTLELTAGVSFYTDQRVVISRWSTAPPDPHRIAKS